MPFNLLTTLVSSREYFPNKCCLIFCNNSGDKINVYVLNRYTSSLCMHILLLLLLLFQYENICTYVCMYVLCMQKNVYDLCYYVYVSVLKWNPKTLNKMSYVFQIFYLPVFFSSIFSSLFSFYDIRWSIYFNIRMNINSICLSIYVCVLKGLCISISFYFISFYHIKFIVHVLLFDTFFMPLLKLSKASWERERDR